jgi:hypothetical protein
MVLSKGYPSTSTKTVAEQPGDDIDSAISTIRQLGVIMHAAIMLPVVSQWSSYHACIFPTHGGLRCAKWRLGRGSYTAGEGTQAHISTCAKRARVTSPLGCATADNVCTSHTARLGCDRTWHCGRHNSEDKGRSRDTLNPYFAHTSSLLRIQLSPRAAVHAVF